MELFDKKYVYFMWDDALEGKRGFTSDDIYTLQQIVNRGSIMSVLHKFEDEAIPFKDENGVEWRFAYYDPNYECKRAYNEGKQIQCKGKFEPETNWVDDNKPRWIDNCVYRIKSTGEYRPYRDIDEMIEDYKWKHNIVYNEDVMPLIWVKNKSSDDRHLITGCVQKQVFIEDEWKSLNYLFAYCEYLDGTPCGIKEN